MPGAFFMFEAKVNGKLTALFQCDRCRKIFAFENEEKLYCPRCKVNLYPVNLEPDKGQSKIITP